MLGHRKSSVMPHILLFLQSDQLIDCRLSINSDILVCCE